MEKVDLIMFMGQSNMAGRGRAQERLAAQNEDIVLVSRLFATFADRGLMKDQFHYRQKGYDLVGAEAGKNAGRYIVETR